MTISTQQNNRRTFKSLIPILEWLPNYDMSWLRWDVIAALTVWALLVPEAMAYAGIAGMPPEAGLYTAPLALLGYAIFGTSRHLNVGPSSTVAVLSFAIVGVLAITGTEQYIAMTAGLALLTGIVLTVAGFLKLGVLADFLSKPVMGGFIIGLAITIAFGQVGKIVGYSVEADGFFKEVLRFVLEINLVHIPTLIVGLTSFAGITFLWFVGVVRDRLGEFEDQLFATVLFGSSLLFMAMVFVSMAVAGGLLASARQGLHNDLIIFGRHIMLQISNVYALRMAGVFMTSLGTIWWRTGLMPRWLAVSTFLLAVMLLLVNSLSVWVALVFPGWVLMISLYILVRQRQAIS